MHALTVPQQQDNVQCGVSVLCYHQVVFSATQDQEWRSLEREARYNRLIQWLQKVTPEMAAQKQRHMRETFHTYGARFDAQVMAQMVPLLVDLSQENGVTLSSITGTRKRRWDALVSATVKETGITVDERLGWFATR
jgi:hypothetical protein